VFIALSLMFISCKKDDGTDKEKPAISLGFPKNCDTLYFGETLNFRALFTDNEELGSYSLDIHHNFDHHSHSTEVTECELDSIKDPVSPYLMIQDYSIPAGLKTFEALIPLPIPNADGNSLYDEGDYHFFISLTDHEGWTVYKGLSVKILRR